MSVRKFCRYILIWFVAGFQSYAQPLFDIETYSYEDGLSHNIITCIMQDSRGLMWIASWNGLFSFDGYVFTNYRPQPGDGTAMNNARISVIQESSSGNIWCINQDLKAYLFDINSKHFLDVLMSVEMEMHQDNRVQRIITLKKGVTWILCEGGNNFRVRDELIPSREAVEVYSSYERTWKGDTIYTVEEDAEGNEWILTDKGVNIIGSVQFDNDYPFHCIKEAGGYIWLASEDGYIAKYNKKTEHLSFLSMPDNVRQINLLYVDPDSILCAGTDAGILSIDMKTDAMTQIDVRPSSKASNEVFAIYKDRYHDFWVFGPGQGVIHLAADGRKECLQSPKNPIIEDKSTIRFDIFEDVSGYLWVLPRNGHLCYYDRQEKCLKNAYVQHSLLSAYSSEMPFLPNLRTSCIDRQGNFWLAASSVDLCRMSFYEKHFEWIGSNQSGVEIRAVYLDGKGRKWVAEKDGLLTVYEPDGHVRYLSGDGVLHSRKTFFGYNVYTIMEDAVGNIWLGTRNNGLYRMTPQSDGNYRASLYKPQEGDPYSLNGASVYSIFQDSRQHIWVGTYEKGLNLLEEDDRHQVRFIHSGNRLKNFAGISRIRHIAENKDGILLLAGSEGLVTFSSDFSRPEEIRMYVNSRRPNDARSLSGNEVMYVYVDSRNDVYLMTQNAGMNKIVSDNLLSEDIEMEVYNEKNGLASDLTLSMMEDAEGMLWIVSKYMLSRFDPVQNTFEHFGKYTFRETLLFSEASILYDADSCMNIGTDRGVLSFYPDRLKKEHYVPDLIITGLKLQNEVYEHNADLLERLVLNPSQRNLSIGYVALDYTNPENIRYAYKMEGVDEDWNEVGDNRTAQYTNLPDGNFCFMLTSTNSDGVWTGNIKRLPIVVKPAFGETCWPWILLVLGVLSLGVLVMSVMFTIYRLRHKVDMEQQLSDIKLRFFTNVSHEFRTPLSLIAGPVNEVLENESITPTVRRHLELVRKNTDRLLHLVNQILDFRKIQNKKMKVMLEYVNIVEQTRKIMDNFLSIAQEKNICFEMICDEPTVSIWVDRDKYEKIVFNLLSNAFKYTHQGKSVKVKLWTDNTKAYVVVADEGIGIPAKKIDSIFNRFEMMDDREMQQQSSGIGLSLVKELIGLLHAEINVSSKQGVGSEFKLAFPRDKSVFDKDEGVEFILKDESSVAASSTPVARKGAMEMAMEKEEASNAGTGTYPVVLVVEDNEEMRSFLKDILSKNYQVMTAADGKEGLDKAVGEMPDLIVTDVMMPVMDGLDMVKAIKENNDICHIPIIVLSAKASLDDRIAGLEKGIDDYVTKPFSASYLKTKIKSLLTQRKSLQEAFLASLSVGAPVLAGDNSSAGDPVDRTTAVDNPTMDLLMPSMPKITSYDESFIRSLMTFMEENMDNEDLTVEDLAEALLMSRTVFYKKIKSLLGISPVDFIKDIRVKRAVQLMDSGSMSLSEIAYSCGFSDPNYFSKCFKKQMGITPSRYKESLDADKKKRMLLNRDGFHVFIGILIIFAPSITRGIL